MAWKMVNGVMIDAAEFCMQQGVPLPDGVSKFSDVDTLFGCEIANALPHGSGINYDWMLDERKDRLYASNRYDTMDEGGGYGPAVVFNVMIPKKNPREFTLHFGKGDHYLAEKYMLRQYLDDIIRDALDGCRYSSRWVWDKDDK